MVVAALQATPFESAFSGTRGELYEEHLTLRRKVIFCRTFFVIQICVAGIKVFEVRPLLVFQ